MRTKKIRYIKKTGTAEIGDEKVVPARYADACVHTKRAVVVTEEETPAPAIKKSRGKKPEEPQE